MKEANPGKPKAEWKPPKGYKSAIAKARDAEREKQKREKENVRKTVFSK